MTQAYPAQAVAVEYWILVLTPGGSLKIAGYCQTGLYLYSMTRKFGKMEVRSIVSMP